MPWDIPAQVPLPWRIRLVWYMSRLKDAQEEQERLKKGHEQSRRAYQQFE